MPPKLREIVGLFEELPEDERRTLLLHYARQSELAAPKPGESFQWEDVRQDAECSDRVGVHLAESAGRMRVVFSLGPQVQTLTRALAAILAQGLDGCSASEIAGVEEDVIPRLVGSSLVRQRSQTVFYVLRRLKSAIQHLSAINEDANILRP